MLNMELKNKGISRSLKNKIIEAWKEETLQYEEFISPDAYRFYTPELTPEKMTYMPEPKKDDKQITGGQWKYICDLLDRSQMNKEICGAIRDIARCLYISQADWLIKELTAITNPATDKQKKVIIDISVKLEIPADVDVKTAREADALIKELKAKLYEHEANIISEEKRQTANKWYYEATGKHLSENFIKIMNDSDYELIKKRFAPPTPQEQQTLKEMKEAEIKRAANLEEALADFNKKFHSEKANNYNGFDYNYDNYFSDKLGW